MSSGELPTHQPPPEKRIGVVRSFAKKTALVVSNFGLFLLISPSDGGNIVNPNTNSPTPTEPIPATAPLLEPQVPMAVYSKDQAKENSLTDLRYQKEIEKKYGIELLTMEQAYDFMGKEYNQLHSGSPSNPPVVWSSEQLKMYDELFSFMPSSLLEPINGKDLKLFQDTLLETDCSCNGQSFGNTGVIYVLETNLREKTFTTTIHEATHRLDNLTGFSIQKGVKEIIGDRLQELHTQEVFISDNTEEGDGLSSRILLSLANKDADQPQIGNTDLGNHHILLEGVAELSEMYIRGHKEFMESLGPILDGKGESIKQTNPTISLAENFPNTQALYNYYKDHVFGGKEYDAAIRQLINGGSQDISKNETVVDLVKKLEQNFGITIEWDKNTLHQGGLAGTKLPGMLEAFPKDFYATPDGKELIIHFGTGVSSGSEFSFSESEDKINLNYYDFFIDSRIGIIGQSSEKTVSVVNSLTNDLVRRRDAATGFKTRDNITRILGGEVFFNSPKALYPELNKITGSQDPYAGNTYSIFYSGDLLDQKVRNPSEIVGRLAVLYMKGWPEFNNSLEPFLGKKTSEIYREMRDLYDGVEYVSWDTKGFPKRR